MRTPDGGQAPLRIVDTVYDPALSPSPQEQTARGYLTPTWPGALLDQVKIQVDEPASADRDRIAAVATDLARWLRDQGVGVREVQVPEPGSTPTSGRPTPCSPRSSRAGPRRCCCPRCSSRSCSTRCSPGRSRRSAS
ncbi:hypothetical protein ACFQV2_13115 [Actinokineospora soli]|uniref:Uncharacterized protein n=1 Tax=Actinokineospora soli TaxID=1048753 RepID=A0ABW2TLT3_9PSEU